VSVIEKVGLCRKLRARAHLSTTDIYLGQLEKELIQWRKRSGVQEGQQSSTGMEWEISVLPASPVTILT